MEKPKPMELIPRVDMKRKPGAQPGNVNAWKHGFYSRRFKLLELCDLEAVLSNSLNDEIALLRVVIRRVFNIADKDAVTLKDWSMALSTLGAAATRLAGLIRAQNLSGGKQDIEEFLADAIGGVADDLSRRFKK